MNWKIVEGAWKQFPGMVPPSGFARPQTVSDKAVEVARGAGGVKSVKNDMRVQ